MKQTENSSQSGVNRDSNERGRGCWIKGAGLGQRLREATWLTCPGKGSLVKELSSMLSASSVHVHVCIHVSNLIPLAMSPSTVSGVNKPPWNMQQAFRAGEQKMIYVDANKKQRITKYKKPTTNNNNNSKNNNRRSSYKNNNNKFNWFLNLASKPSPFLLLLCPPPCQPTFIFSVFHYFIFCLLFRITRKNARIKKEKKRKIKKLESQESSKLET